MNTVILTVFMISLPAFGLDEIRNPPESRKFFSPNAKFALVITTPDKWHSKIADVDLYRATGKSLSKQLWHRQLPYSFGPRYVLLHNNGTVMLIDEWMNVKSNHAIYMIDLFGQIIADYSYANVRNALGISERDLIDRAERGWWVAGFPSFDADNKYVIVPAGGKILRIRIIDGQLSRN